MLASVHPICYLNRNLSSDTYEKARRKCRKAEDRISDLGTTDDATKTKVHIIHLYSDFYYMLIPMISLLSCICLNILIFCVICITEVVYLLGTVRARIAMKASNGLYFVSLAFCNADLHLK